jgi:N utilization substance protein B
MTNETNSSASANAAKRLARLAAVQALYQSTYGEETLAQIVRGSIDQGFKAFIEDEGAETFAAPDAELFSSLVFGVAENQEQLDELLAGALDARFSPERMEILLRMILRAGTFELLHQGSTPAPIIISDYVDVARAFFQAKEPGLVNAVLDKLAKKLRD